MSSIAEIHDKKEAHILDKCKVTDSVEARESHAAKVLQRNYRGHRERRQLRGLSLDPTTRWTEVSLAGSDTIDALLKFS